MNDDASGSASKTEPVTDWRRLRAMSDEDVHAAVAADPDIMPTDEAFWKDAPYRQYPIAQPSLRPSDAPMNSPRCQSMAIAWAPPQGRSRTATL
jgi:hypothetical protein